MEEPLEELEAAWLAGLLEGEGCFHVRSDDGRPLVKLNMTDRDVIEHVARLVGATYCHRPAVDDRHKDQYVIYLSNEKARAVMRRVRPYMGVRRSRAILDAIGQPAPTLFSVT